MTLKQRLQRQIDAALSPENRWYCAEFYGCEITDPDTLMEYFIKHGGAEAFREAEERYGAVVGVGAAAFMP
jgi:hypothetical protein